MNKVHLINNKLIFSVIIVAILFIFALILPNRASAHAYEVCFEPTSGSQSTSFTFYARTNTEASIEFNNSNDVYSMTEYGSLPPCDTTSGTWYTRTMTGSEIGFTGSTVIDIHSHGNTDSSGVQLLDDAPGPTIGSTTGWTHLGNGNSTYGGTQAWTSVATIPSDATKIALARYAMEEDGDLSGDQGNYTLTLGSTSCSADDDGPWAGSSSPERDCTVIASLGSSWTDSTTLTPDCGFRYVASTRTVEFEDARSNEDCGIAVFYYTGESINGEGSIVFNAKNASNPDSTYEQPFIDDLQDHGYDVTVISDNQVCSYNYSNSELLIIRPDEDDWIAHPSCSDIDRLNVDVISLNRHTSRGDLDMSSASGPSSSDYYTISDTNHPISSGYSGTVDVYTSSAVQNRISNLNSDVTLPIHYNGVSSYAGVALKESGAYTRAHWSAHRGSILTSDGWSLWRNLIEYIAGEPIEPPSVNTNSASQVAQTTATLNGSANPNGDDTIGWFRYYESNNPGSCSNNGGVRVPSDSGEGSDLGSGDNTISFNEDISNLTPGTDYYVCAFASNSAGDDEGSVDPFTTESGTPTSVTADGETNLGSSSVTLTGSANPNGYATTGFFRLYESDPESCIDIDGEGIRRIPADQSNDIDIGNSTTSQNFDADVSDLDINSTYYYCVYATNTYGTSSSNPDEFTTIAGPAYACDAPTSGNQTIQTSCSYEENIAGVDSGSGTTNEAQITLNTNRTLTVNPGQTVTGNLSPNAAVHVAVGGTMVSQPSEPIWVIDSDGDGYIANSQQHIGEQPAGGVRRNTVTSNYPYQSLITGAEEFDCDDSDPNITDTCGTSTSTPTPEQTCTNGYRDYDGDGYGTGALDCYEPSSSYGVVDNNTDCNDSDASEYQNLSCYTSCSTSATQVCGGSSCESSGYTSNSTSTPNFYYAFVSSTTHRGDFGGVNSADNICQNLADSAGLPGTYTAWVSTNANNEPRDRGLSACYNAGSSSLEWRLTDGTTVIANNWEDLTDDQLDAAFILDENGNVPPDDPYTNAWTSTNGDGSYQTNYNCMNYTNGSYNPPTGVDGLGWYGRGQDYNESDYWTDRGATTCEASNHIYCFQSGE